MSNVVPLFPEPLGGVARLMAARWEIRYVTATDEFLVWDKTRKALRGQAVVCESGDAVLRFVEGVLTDEAARR